MTEGERGRTDRLRLHEERRRDYNCVCVWVLGGVRRQKGPEVIVSGFRGPCLRRPPGIAGEFSQV